MTTGSDSGKIKAHHLKTERIERAVEDVIHGDRLLTPGIRDASLTPEEQKLFDEYAAELRAGNLECDADLWKLDYFKKPPDIEEFLLNDYYLGKTWRPMPGENEGIWPTWFGILTEWLNIGSRIHNMVLTGSLGTGKCLGYNERCLMFDGSTKPVQKIKTGEQLMGDDSTPRRVMSTTKGRGPLFQIYPAKGEPFVCNDAHVLCLKSSVSDAVEHVSVTDFLAWPRQKRHQARLYRTGCDWPKQPVSVDPYWLGIWLGDGDTNSPTITSADDEIVRYHIAYAESLGLSVTVFVDKRGNAAKTYSASVKDRRKARMEGNPLRKLLNGYGLCAADGSQIKRIPCAYLHNSRAIRLQVMAGLIDTDGSKSRGGKRTAKHAAKQSNGVYEITVKPKEFADDIRFLAQSLGYFAQTKIKICNSTAYYRTFISGAYDLQPKITRKQTGSQGRAVLSPLTGHLRSADCLKTKFAVIPLGEGDYYGFELDKNHCFLLKDFTVTHNTALMVTIILYRLCIACHLKNPQNFFGLNRNSNIVYNFLSVTKEAVKDTAFGVAMDYMGDSAFFVEHCKYQPDSDYSGYRIPMLNTLADGRTSGLWVSAGSKGQHVLGRNLLGIGLDEGNFRLEKDPDLAAYALYDSVRTRIANRFQKIASYLPAISVLASSAADESSFTEKIVAEIEESNRQRDVENRTRPEGTEEIKQSQIVFRHAVYRIKRHALPGIGPDHHWFRVCYGLKNMEPYILSGWYQEDGTAILEDPHEEPPPGAKTEMVPKFYWEAFRRNCKAQLQNLSGISVGGAHRLFSSLIDIEHCLAASSAEQVPNPMKPGVSRLPISSEDALHIWDYLDHKAFLTRVLSRIQPKRHPMNLRYAHIDLATQTLAGLAICHLAGAQLVEGLVRDGEPFSEYRLVIEYDFILTICAGETKPINIEKIQRFFFWLRDMCGFRFGLITADMFQSEAPLQMLEAKNFKVDKLSIDRDKSVYTAWRAGFEEHRIRLHRNEQMIREAEQLLEMDKKFDHPPTEGSKDTCFTGDTRIKLLDGSVPTIAELAKCAEPFWIYASDGCGGVLPAKATAKQTGNTRHLVRVVLDSSKTIYCTPEHRFLLRSGAYKKAKDLGVGDSLMPLYTVYKSIKSSSSLYERVYSNGHWEYTHRLVCAAVGVKVKPTEVVHHRNFKSKDNTPENLMPMDKQAHDLFHQNIGRERNKQLWQQPDYRRKQLKRLKDYAQSRTGRTISSRTASRTNKNWRDHWTDKRLKAHQQNIQSALRLKNQRGDAKAINVIKRYRPYLLGVYHAIHLTGGGNYTWHRRLAGTDWSANAEKLRGFSTEKMCHLTGLNEASLRQHLRHLNKYDIFALANHKVIAIRNLRVPPTAVYDLAVAYHHNFALEAGVFVHNCDAAAGAYFNAINSDEKMSIASYNAPGVYGGNPPTAESQEKPPIEIPLPERGYSRSRVFEA